MAARRSSLDPGGGPHVKTTCRGIPAPLPAAEPLQFCTIRHRPRHGTVVGTTPAERKTSVEISPPPSVKKNTIKERAALIDAVVEYQEEGYLRARHPR